jgi:hypothetical protein
LKIAKQETAAQRSVAAVEKTVAKQKIKELQTETMKEKKLSRHKNILKNNCDNVWRHTWYKLAKST